MEAKAILGVRISPDVKQQLAAVAKAQHRTSSNLVEWLIKQYLEQVPFPANTSVANVDFATTNELSRVLNKRRPAIADTLHYLEDK